ncbi:MAG: glycoside hydrolase family 9 protein [Lachnospiraceae bacterium]|nr:glycoside hydrolase family 9 protein [Lachnospiraceae bacterium]
MKQKNGFKLNTTTGYFQNHGVNIMAFDDIYPVGHQSGVSILMHGNRVATNGDIRFEQTPGQWQPVPKQKERKLNEEKNTIETILEYPDYENHLKGFNPMIYPDFEFEYKVTVEGKEDSVVVTVDLEKPVPEEFRGKLCFNMELFPGDLFGKPWIMDKKQGIFPRQANGPTLAMKGNYAHTRKTSDDTITADMEKLSGNHKGYNPIIADELIAEPYAVGKRFTVRPDDPYNRFTVESRGTELKLYDGRMNHNNGWFVISSEIPDGKTEKAVEWVITPNVVGDWMYTPVVQVSQVGYHPDAAKIAIIELDCRDTKRERAILYKITENGEEEVLRADCMEWGRFLRYNYLKFDFSEMKEESLYKVCYGNSESAIFRIAEDIYDRGVWQPVLEYFLPVQMCHMRVSEKYRVWHDLCHEDDARMAPVNYNHFDGYVQGASTLTKYQPGECVPGLNVGGWHDAGDFDLRVESQAGEVYKLALAYEAFQVDYDATTIDQTKKITEIHQPDGKNDILQQIEHGLLSLVGGYHALGRLYRGIICNDLRQYVLLGDSAAMTGGVKGDEDDRLVFTEENPVRELTTAAQMAAAAKALKGFNDTLSRQALEAAAELYEITDGSGEAKAAKLHAAVELYLTTEEIKYKEFLFEEKEFIVKNIKSMGWIISRVIHAIDNEEFVNSVREAMLVFRNQLDEESKETPYGIPYRPHIWGAGWEIQRLGVEYYFLHKAFPDIFEPDLIFHALNFILGCHPGSNTASFASGVGAKSATVAYGANRADWSYIPGGVVSGTALIRPDFPELLEFPYLWQQTEYVLGGGSSDYMFLVLAARELLSGK